MSRPVQQGTFNRSCRACGWSGTYTTAGRGNYAKKRHSCERQLEVTARLARGEERRRLWAKVDRTPKICNHKIANHEHGTHACYVLDKCRCDPCSQAEYDYERTRTLEHVYGRWDNLVDATPAREHVRDLMNQGMGLKRIAKVSGVSQGSLWKLLYGKKGTTGVQKPSARILKGNAAKLLATPLARADGATAPAEDADRARTQLRALVALGWSMSRIAARLEVTPSNMKPFFHGGRGMSAGNVRTITALFDELSMTLPPQTEHRDKISASRARSYAKRHGWLPPLALDADLDHQDEGHDIDDQAVYRRLHGDHSVKLTTAERHEVVRRCHAAGNSDRETHRLTGIHSDQVRRDRQALGLPAVTARQEAS